MINAPVIKSQFGQHYIVTTARQAQQQPNLTAETFINVSASEHFVQSLQTPFGYWQQLAQHVNIFPYNAWQAQNPWGNIEKYIAQAVTQGAVKVFKTASLVELNQNSKIRHFKTAQGKRYQLLPASACFTTAASDLSNIVNRQQAQQLIAGLNLDDRGAKALNDSLCITTNRDALSSPTTVSPFEQLNNAIANGDVILSLQPEARKPIGDGEFEVQDTPQVVNQAPPAPAAKPETAVKPEIDNKKAENGDADSLIKAAEDGTPFCEECEKKKKAA